jgi:hypothetical protein
MTETSKAMYQSYVVKSFGFLGGDWPKNLAGKLQQYPEEGRLTGYISISGRIA